jgi:hypothetical protein
MEYFEHDLKGLLALQKSSNRKARVAMLGEAGELALTKGTDKRDREPPFKVAMPSIGEHLFPFSTTLQGGHLS